MDAVAARLHSQVKGGPGITVADMDNIALVTAGETLAA
jgi:hypothetical protein